MDTAWAACSATRSGGDLGQGRPCRIAQGGVSDLLDLGMAQNQRLHLQPVEQLRRQDGSGRIDQANPHPGGKVPALDHDGAIVLERPAILTYLSDLFPDASAVRPAGHPQRGPFVTWLAC